MTYLYTRRAGALLAAAALCLITVSCGAISAMSPEAYLGSVGAASIDLSALPAGAYTGDYTLALPPGMFAKNRHFNVTVTVDSAAAVHVTINSPASLQALGDEATQELNDNIQDMIGRIEAAGAIPVDGVSGATCTSMALLKAIETAVTQ